MSSFDSDFTIPEIFSMIHNLPNFQQEDILNIFVPNTEGKFTIFTIILSKSCFVQVILTTSEIQQWFRISSFS